jgi:hypothetical protein
MESIYVIDSEFDEDEKPRYWCADCHAFRFTRRDVDGYPICRVCSPTTRE